MKRLLNYIRTGDLWSILFFGACCGAILDVLGMGLRFSETFHYFENLQNTYPTTTAIGGGIHFIFLIYNYATIFITWFSPYAFVLLIGPINETFAPSLLAWYIPTSLGFEVFSITFMTLLIRIALRKSLFLLIIALFAPLSGIAVAAIVTWFFWRPHRY